MKRKVIQIALTSDGDKIIALADDGTIWYIVPRGCNGMESATRRAAASASERRGRIRAELRFEEMKKRHEGEGSTAVEPS